MGCQSLASDVAVCVQAVDCNLDTISNGLVGEAGAVEGQNVVLVVRIQGSILGGEGCILGCRGCLRSGGLGLLGCRSLSLGCFRSGSFFLGGLSLGSLGCRGYGSGSLVSLGSLGCRGYGCGSLFVLGSLGRSRLGDLEGGDSHELLVGLTLRVADSSQCVGCASGQLACLNGNGSLEGAVLNLLCGYHNGSESLTGDLVVCVQCVDADLYAGANLLTVEAGANNAHGVQLCVTGEASILNNDGGVSLLCLGCRGGGGGRLGGCRSGGGRSLSLGSLGCVSLRSLSLGGLCLRCFGCLSLRSFGLRSLSLRGFGLRSLSLRSLSCLSLRSLGCLSLGGLYLRSLCLGCFSLRSLSLGGLSCVAARQGRSLSSCLLVDNLLLLIGGCFCREGCRDRCHRTSGKSCRSCDLVNATGSLRHFSSISELSVVNLRGAPPSLRGAQVHIRV